MRPLLSAKLHHRTSEFRELPCLHVNRTRKHFKYCLLVVEGRHELSRGADGERAAGGVPRGFGGMGLTIFFPPRTGPRLEIRGFWVSAKWDGAEAGRAKLDLILERVRRRESTGALLLLLSWDGTGTRGVLGSCLGTGLRGPHGA